MHFKLSIYVSKYLGNLLVGKEFMADLLVDLMFDKMQIYALNGGLNQAYLLHLKKLWVKNPLNFSLTQGHTF